MTLVRVWRRQLLGGMGTAVIVPATLLGSLAVLALAGGFAGFTALGEALSGPSAPAGVTATGHAATVARPVPATLAAALSAPATQSVAPSAAQTAAGGATPGGATRSGSQPSFPGSPAPGGQSPSGHAQPPAGGSPGASQPAPRPQPTVADRVVAAGTSITSQVPGPAGSAATKGLQTAGSTLDSIAPIKSP